MTNVNIQGAINLFGRGHVEKAGAYQPGEFKNLRNLVISENNYLTNRPSIKVALNVDTDLSAVVSYGLRGMMVPGFLGQIRGQALAASDSYQRAVTDFTVNDCWRPSSLPKGGPGAFGFSLGPYHYIVGAFEYNNTAYWITRDMSASYSGVKICLYYKALPSKTDLASDVTFASLTRVELFTDLSGQSDLDVVDFLVHKDRLWIATKDTLYFSKATDPTVFAVPDGGFFKILERGINKIVALNDSVFIVTDNTIHQLTYSDDPNLDSSLRRVSDNIGGVGACIFRSTLYFVNQDAIFSLVNNRVNKEIECDFTTRKLNTKIKMVPHKNYIYLIFRDTIAYNDPGRAGYPTVKDTATVYTDALPNVFGINMDRNHVYAVDFHDQFDNSGIKFGSIVDMISMFKVLNGVTYNYLAIATICPYQGSSAGPNHLDHITAFYFMADSDLEDTLNYESVRLSSGVILKRSQSFCLEVDSYIPDGSEYLMKKYRNFLISGQLPYYNMTTIKFAGDNVDYDAGRILTQDYHNVTLSKSRKFYPFRVGVNRRARSMSVRIESPNVSLASVVVPNTELDPGLLVVEDMRFLWSYIGRVPESKTVTIP